MILIGGTVALGTAMVHKFTKKDVEQIEAKTGKPAEELTDEELQQVTQQLGIQGAPLSEAEMQEVEKAEDEADAE